MGALAVRTVVGELERDVLMLPCELVDSGRRKEFLWAPTTAAQQST
jgi:hypothetical protein